MKAQLLKTIKNTPYGAENLGERLKLTTTAAACWFAFAVVGSGATIDFETIPGMDNAIVPVPVGSQLADQFLSSFGVRFSSGSPYVAVVGLGEGHAASGFNAIGGTTPGGLLTYDGAFPIVATFFDPNNPAVPATTDFVSLRIDLFPNSGQSVRLNAFDLQGQLIDSFTTLDSSGGTLQVAGPGIHSVQFIGTTDSLGAAVDDFTFNPVVPGPSVHYVDMNSTNATPPYTSWATAATNIQDAVDDAVAGDEIVVTNGIYATGGRAVGTNLSVNRVAVDKPLTLRSVNGPLFTTIDGGGSNRCVYLPNGASLSGFTLTGGTAASGGGGGVACGSATVVVSNCTLTGNSAYDSGGGASGGTLINCTLSGNRALGQLYWHYDVFYGWHWSTDVSYGGGASGCTLNNCTLTGNRAAEGGGASGCTLNNCSLTANTALGYGQFGYPGGLGGGAYECTLNNCTLRGNSAVGFSGYRIDPYVCASGGGAYGSRLNNCTLTDNSADALGGGVVDSTLNNCIVYFNTAPWGDNYVSDNPYHPFDELYYQFSDYFTSYFNQCWATPANAITNAPLFVDRASGNLRLQSNSPCINAGNNSYAVGSTDLDGNPRIAGGTVDIGAYEFPTPASQISYPWLKRYGLPIDANTDASDPDADGLNNWQEWRCLTDPTNAFSALRLLAPVTTGTNVAVSWQSVAGVNYFLERSTNLAALPAFMSLATNLVGQPGTTSFIDTNTVGNGPFFYRVGVGD